MSSLKTIGLILLAALITFLLRLFPFLIFNDKRKMPESLIKLGKVLPGAIMAVLIIYCLKDVGTQFMTTGIPQIVAVLIVGITYKWKHNTMLSIFTGTVTNMLLIHLM